MNVTTGKRLKIDGKVYKAQALADITLDDLIMFDSHVTEAGYAGILPGDGDYFDAIEAMADRDDLSTVESVLMTAIMVWLMKRAAGEEITLKEAAKIKGSAIEEVGEPGDRKAPKAGKKGKASRPASARASAPRLVAREVAPEASPSKSATA